MKTFKIIHPLLIALVLLPACQEQTNTSSSEATELEQVYSAFNTEYDSIMTQYGHMQSEMAPQLREQYSRMQMLYAELQPMHNRMMGIDTMGDHMMGGDTVGSNNQHGLMNWGALRATDERMRNLQHAMADSLNHHGFGQMAQMHEQMANYCDQALQLSESLMD